MEILKKNDAMMLNRIKKAVPIGRNGLGGVNA